MEQRRIDIDEADVGLHHRRAEAEREQRQRGHRAQQHDLDEMHPRPRQPVHSRRRMVDGVEAPEERHRVEQPVIPVLEQVREHDHREELHQPRQRRDPGAEALPAAGVRVDIGLRRQRQEGEGLHHHRTDEVIEQVLAPLDAEQALLRAVREEPLDRREHEAGDEQVDDEEVQPEENAPGAHFRRLDVRSADQRRGKADDQRGRPQRLARAQQQAEQRQRIGGEQQRVDGKPELRPVLQRLQLGHGEKPRIAQRQHHAEAADREQQREEARKPARAEAAHLDRRLQIGFQVPEEITQHVPPLPKRPSLRRFHRLGEPQPRHPPPRPAAAQGHPHPSSASS